MKLASTYPLKLRRCKCGLRIYQFNFHCVGCGRAIGTCGKCFRLTSFTLDDNEYFCDQHDCGCHVQQCGNRLQNFVCNSMLPKTNEEDTAQLCSFCELTVLIPPLSNPLNLVRWRKLELAKRQLHTQLRSLRLPPYSIDPRIDSVPPLSYRFVELSSATTAGSPVMMGHEQGMITIIAEEADTSYRERQRESLNEPQRTLVGHFRHEIGHYIDLVGIHPSNRKRYHELFGDPNSIDYEEAKQKYYGATEPIPWQTKFISKYAAMHPWEDFAETVDAFLDLAAVMQVASDHGIMEIQSPIQLCTSNTIAEYREIALLSNELNYSRGLDMLIPEIISEPVRTKLQFVASLCQFENADSHKTATTAPGQ